MTDRIHTNEESGIKVFTIDHLNGQGITMQDVDNPNAWLAMREAVDLHKWK